MAPENQLLEVRPPQGAVAVAVTDKDLEAMR